MHVMLASGPPSPSRVLLQEARIARSRVGRQGPSSTRRQSLPRRPSSRWGSPHLMPGRRAPPDPARLWRINGALEQELDSEHLPPCLNQEGILARGSSLSKFHRSIRGLRTHRHRRSSAQPVGL
ncbi:uncharacterized protein LOC123440057 [Hordeum vulgare subsp. vulgare]|uniref:Predicted protein n=1 Tax=Hordeum vulgare subsp. vulgare TaxID=112509 RepID=F2DLW9_HORVV|nr:uncharacterized protein LOC123440057 [Hordeum vulgare subsp. vulgare]BAJ96090.1 predicted protein [Hordeum vulgare subsp. vulgare]